jgi:hypothetical protein
MPTHIEGMDCRLYTDEAYQIYIASLQKAEERIKTEEKRLRDMGYDPKTINAEIADILLGK